MCAAATFIVVADIALFDMVSTIFRVLFFFFPGIKDAIILLAIVYQFLC